MTRNKEKAIEIIAWVLVLTSLMFGFTDTIDTSLPAGSDDPAEADDNMRRIQGGFQEILAVEHDVSLTGTEITGDGKHTDITTDSIVNAGALANTGDVAVNTDKFTVAAATGNTVVAGTLDVTGNIDPTTYEKTNGGFLDEDDMVSDADDKVASQQSINARIDALIGHDGDSYVLRDVDETPTKVYTKYLTGTFDATSTKNVAHKITGVDNILDVRVVAYSTNAYYVAQNTFGAASSTISFQVTFDGTNIIFMAIGSTIQSQKYRIRIDYIL